MTPVDLDVVGALEDADPAGMLPHVASSAAQVRASAAVVAEAGVADALVGARPRALVCVGMGGSGIAGDVLAAVVGPGCRIPVVVHKDFGLPAWVGATDVVLATSCSGTTAETLSAVDEALRRGAQLVAVGAAGSPLAGRAEQARAPYVPVPGGRPPRASMWALSVPGLIVADALGLLGGALALEATALRLEQVAAACHVGRDTLVNPAKSLAAALDGRAVSVWGTSAAGAVAAYRFACQLNENAKRSATYGCLPEAGHNQIVAFDAPVDHTVDLFHDPDLDGPTARGAAQILLREPGGERTEVSARAEAAVAVAADRGVRLTELAAEGADTLERLASLVGLLDFASVYAALAAGVDPSPVPAIDALKRRTG